MPTPPVERQDTPAQRSARARRAALSRHSFAPDNMATARAAKFELFARAVDPSSTLDPEERHRRANRLFKAWHVALSYETGRRRRGQSYRALVLGPWLESMKRAATPESVAAQEEHRVGDRSSS